MAALIYNSLTSISTTNTKCNSPYEYVIGSSTSNSVVIALYSYSTVSAKADNSFCSTSVQIQDFYTNPFNFIPWDEEKTGARILRKHTDTTTYNKTTNIHFAMIIPDSNTKEQCPSSNGEGASDTGSEPLQGTVTVTITQSPITITVTTSVILDGSSSDNDSKITANTIFTTISSRTSGSSSSITLNNPSNSEGILNNKSTGSSSEISSSAISAAPSEASGEHKSSGGLSQAAIIAIVVIILDLIADLGYYIYRKRKEKMEDQQADQQAATTPRPQAISQTYPHFQNRYNFAGNHHF
ncbi:hypothetical protein GGI25_003527 [Coemansia spiralis]|uniref:Uncharacterized protein n=2 Tax=Coemansia TaxID=4863 RepID=A0A9W8KY93_9FUNG|nr:hypothetical protein EDC05_004061 [Coemansia umbellata]KAJ2622096.1 hypothetical protein GGI26_003538 [Coemansia sp. RSA 1358]KAJ2676492.1 hypothetical protein GGI25_003527 [Coemansia spiralis]